MTVKTECVTVSRFTLTHTHFVLTAIFPGKPVRLCSQTVTVLSRTAEGVGSNPGLAVYLKYVTGLFSWVDMAPYSLNVLKVQIPTIQPFQVNPG